MSIAHSRHLFAFRGHWPSSPANSACEASAGQPLLSRGPQSPANTGHHNTSSALAVCLYRIPRTWTVALPSATLSRQRGIPGHSAGSAAFSMDTCSICKSSPLPSTAFLVCVQRGSVPMATPITCLCGTPGCHVTRDATPHSPWVLPAPPMLIVHHTPHHARHTNHKPESARR